MATRMAEFRSEKPNSCRYSVENPMATHGIVPTIPCKTQRSEAGSSTSHTRVSTDLILSDRLGYCRAKAVRNSLPLPRDQGDTISEGGDPARAPPADHHRALAQQTACSPGAR